MDVNSSFGSHRCVFAGRKTFFSSEFFSFSLETVGGFSSKSRHISISSIGWNMHGYNNLSSDNPVFIILLKKIKMKKKLRFVDAINCPY